MATVNEKIKNALNTYTPLLKKSLEKLFVSRETGKKLSTNDFTDEEKNKLTGIESGAQKNIIEEIKVDGKSAAIENKSINIIIPAATLPAGITSLGNLSTSENQIPYTTAKDTYQMTSLTSFGRKLLSINDSKELRKLSSRFCDPDFDDCGNTWIPSGNPVLTAKNKTFGNTALQLDGASCLSSENVFYFDGGNFSIDFFYTPSVQDLTGLYTVFAVQSPDYLNLFILAMDEGKLAFYAGFPETEATRYKAACKRNGSGVLTETPYTFIADTTYHFALNYQNGQLWSIYINGGYSGECSIPLPVGSYHIGIGTRWTAQGNRDFYLNGTIDEFRVQKNSPPTGASFAVPTAPYTKDENTLALLHFEN